MAKSKKKGPTGKSKAGRKKAPARPALKKKAAKKAPAKPAAKPIRVPPRLPVKPDSRRRPKALLRRVGEGTARAMPR
ncbi:MAG TPA: hypothetical protein VGB91_14285, partial [Rhizomicrobium sp.]